MTDQALLMFTLYGSIQLFQLRLSPSKAEKSNTSAKSLLGVTIKYTNRTKFSFGGYVYIVTIYIHKKARSNFKLVFSDKPFALIFDLFPCLRDNLN